METNNPSLHQTQGGSLSNTTSSWTNLTATIHPPAGAARLQVRYRIDTTTTGQTHYFDDTTITAIPVTTTAATKTFEAGVDGMSNTSQVTATSTTTEAHTGTRSLQLVPTASGWNVTDTTIIPVDPTKTYQISGQGKTTGWSMTIAVQWLNNTNTVITTTDIGIADSNGTWQPFSSINATPPANATGLRVRLYAWNNFTRYIDNITITAITPTTTTQIWSYPNIHGDTQATTNNTGTKQGPTHTYDPYGNPLTTTPDNLTGGIDNTWLGQHHRWNDRNLGSQPMIQMGARPYNPTLGRFLEVDPVEGGSCNDYDYACADPVNQFDLDGLWCAFGKNKNGSCRGSGMVKKAKTGVRKTYQVARFVRNAPATAVGLVGTKVTTSGSDCGMNWSEVMIICTGASNGLFNPKKATTWGSMFVTGYPEPSTPLISHEAKHADQYAIFGFGGFGVRYLGAELLPGCNPYEIWAGRREGC